MYRRWILPALVIVLSLMLIACSTANIQESTTRTNNQPAINRVITLTSLATDIIYQLDKTKLVGITGSALFKNNPNFQDIPRVSEGQTPPNLEKIVALKPDLVIGAEGFSNQVIQRLKELGISTLLTQIKTWESLSELTQKLAELIDVNPQPLLNRYQSFLPQNSTKNPSTLVLVSNQPILAPNKNSWAGDLLAKFQLKNLAAELQGKSSIGGYITLSPEKVLEANPEAIILVNPPQANSQTDILATFKKEPFWQKLQATQNNRVYVFDYYGLVNPGSLDAIAKACQQLKQDLLASTK